MGRQSRAKRERREQASFTAGLTICEGTWLERPPDEAELARIAAARKELQRRGGASVGLGDDVEAINRLSLEVFRDERFAPLHFESYVIEWVLAQHGEPPIVEDDADDSAFSDYLRAAVGTIASARVRRAIAEQTRRFLPHYVEAGQIREALAIEHNAYLTVMSNMVTPLLVQMLLGGLARYYEEREEDETIDG